MDVVDTGADVARVGLIDEDLEELGIRLGVLDRENIGIQGGNGWAELVFLSDTSTWDDLGLPWKKSWNSE